MKIDVKSEDKILKSLVEFNIMYGRRYANALDYNLSRIILKDMKKEDYYKNNEKDIIGLVVGLIRANNRIKELRGGFINDIGSDLIKISIDSGEYKTISDILKGANPAYVINGCHLYEFNHTNNSPFLAKLSFEAQKYRFSVLKRNKHDVSEGKCFTLAKRLVDICKQQFIPANVAFILSQHATLVVDGVCIDGSWMDGCLFKDDEIVKASDLRSLDDFRTNEFTIMDLEEYSKFYLENFKGEKK